MLDALLPLSRPHVGLRLREVGHDANADVGGALGDRDRLVGQLSSGTHGPLERIVRSQTEDGAPNGRARRQGS